MKTNLRFVSVRLFLAAIACALPFSAFAQQPAPAPSNLSPKQQITGFYSTCKNGEGGKGLLELLSANPTVNNQDAQQVAQAFDQLLTQLGKFLDFNFMKETQISDRTVIIRCAAHFEQQPFVNEFTFYDGGNGWRLVHLRYDKNLATMFEEDLKEPGPEKN